MASITIVGLGPGPLSQMTREAERHLLAADKVFFRTSAYPAFDWLQELGKSLVAFDGLYSLPWPSSDDMYDFMVTALLKDVGNRGSTTYALPGSPSVLEDTTRRLKRRGSAAGVEIRLIQGLSFMETALAAVNFNFSLGLQVVLPQTHLATGRFDPRAAMLVCQAEAKDDRLDRIVDWLLPVYGSDHEVTVIWTTGLPAYETAAATFRLADLAQSWGEDRYFATLFVPPLEPSDE